VSDFNEITPSKLLENNIKVKEKFRVVLVHPATITHSFKLQETVSQERRPSVSVSRNLGQEVMLLHSKPQQPKKETTTSSMDKRSSSVEALTPVSSLLPQEQVLFELIMFVVGFISNNSTLNQPN
jgi:hypothetical protein